MSAAARDHGHTHEAMEHPGKFALRDVPTFEGRNWKERAFTVGIGGPVGSGKTALTLALCRHFRDRLNLGVVTNDIFTREDQEFLIRNEALADKGRIRAIETGAFSLVPGLVTVDAHGRVRCHALHRRMPARSYPRRHLRKPECAGRATGRICVRAALCRERR